MASVSTPASSRRPTSSASTVPRTLAEIRLRSYEEYCWPRRLGAAFRRNSALTALALAAGLTALMFASAWTMNADALRRSNPGGDFYAVVPHAVMVALFGAAGLFVLAALGTGAIRFWRDVHRGPAEPPTVEALGRALRDALTLRHLHTTGVDCPSAEEARAPWRRWFHHCTSYGFLLCFASTTVAAIYHSVFGWHAPYAYTSLPVVLGTLGGAGLLVGTGRALRSATNEGSRAWRSRSGGARRIVPRAAVPDQPDRAPAPGAARPRADGSPAHRPPRHRPRAVPDAAVRKVRARLLPGGRARQVRDRDGARSFIAAKGVVRSVRRVRL